MAFISSYRYLSFYYYNTSLCFPDLPKGRPQRLLSWPPHRNIDFMGTYNVFVSPRAPSSLCALTGYTLGLGWPPGSYRRGLLAVIRQSQKPSIIAYLTLRCWPTHYVQYQKCITAPRNVKFLYAVEQHAVPNRQWGVEPWGLKRPACDLPSRAPDNTSSSWSSDSWFVLMGCISKFLLNVPLPTKAFFCRSSSLNQCSYS